MLSTPPLRWGLGLPVRSARLDHPQHPSQLPVVHSKLPFPLRELQSEDGSSQDGDMLDQDPSPEDMERERMAMMQALHPTGGKRAKTKKPGKNGGRQELWAAYGGRR